MPFHPRLKDLHSFTVAAMIWPTTPGKGRQGLIGHWDEEALAGWLLEIDEQGRLAARVGDGRAAVEVGSGVKLHRSHWYLAAMIYDAAAGTLTVIQRPVTAYGVVTDDGHVAQAAPAPLIPDCAITMAAVRSGDGVGCHYNGRIDSPRLIAKALPPERLEGLFLKPLPADLTGSTLAAWDFAQEIKTTRIVDAGPEGLDGEIVNLPTRAVRGWNWDGSEHCWWRKPAHYGAIHFHDDDIYDAGWQEDFRWTVPDDLRVRRLRRPPLERRRRGRDRGGLHPVLRPAAARGRRQDRPAAARLPRPHRVLHGLRQRPEPHRRQGRRDGDRPAPGLPAVRRLPLRPPRARPVALRQPQRRQRRRPTRRGCGRS